MIQPRCKHPKASEFPSVFMRKNVVRIIRPRAGVLEWSCGRSLEKPACDNAVPSIAPAVHALQQFIEVAFAQRDFAVEAKLIALEVCDVVFGHIETNRVEKFR